MIPSLCPLFNPLTSEERTAALDLLRDKNLPARILADFNLAGVVGENQ